MDAVLPLDKMTVAEKLRAMEVLWADLSRNAETYESPGWHADALRKRDQNIADGKDPSTDWTEAKLRLRQRLR